MAKGRWLEGSSKLARQMLMPDRIKALGLADKWVVKFAGGADALWAELASAKKEGRGYRIIFNWTPNFTDAEGFHLYRVSTIQRWLQKSRWR